MSDHLPGRLAIIRRILDRPGVKPLFYVWAFIAAYDTLISQVVPEEVAQRFPKVREIAAMTSGWLPWWAWFLVLAGLLTAASFEYAFRRTRGIAGANASVVGEPRLNPSAVVVAGLVISAIGLVIVGGGFWLFVQDRSKPPVAPDVANQRPKYTGEMRDRRIKEYIDLIDSLNSTSKDALQTGVILINGFPNDIITKGPQQYAERIRKFTISAGDSFVALHNVLERYPYFPDIKQMMEEKFNIQSDIYGPASELYNVVLALPDNPTEKLLRLVSNKVDSMRGGVATFDRWINETKSLLAQKMKDESQ